MSNLLSFVFDIYPRYPRCSLYLYALYTHVLWLAWLGGWLLQRPSRKHAKTLMCHGKTIEKTENMPESAWHEYSVYIHFMLHAMLRIYSTHMPYIYIGESLKLNLLVQSTRVPSARSLPQTPPKFCVMFSVSVCMSLSFSKYSDARPYCYV